tara:strand:+ start:529 stop:906 length:378 start_codon:yes stop_codon:yes gene_type:complete
MSKNKKIKGHHKGVNKRIHRTPMGRLKRHDLNFIRNRIIFYTHLFTNCSFTSLGRKFNLSSTRINSIINKVNFNTDFKYVYGKRIPILQRSQLRNTLIKNEVTGVNRLIPPKLPKKIKKWYIRNQ